MVDSGIESSELSALEGAAADELDDMNSEEAERFIERLKAEGLCEPNAPTTVSSVHSELTRCLTLHSRR